MDTNLVGVLQRQAIVLLDGGPTSGLGLGVHRDSIPMHTFARFLFVALLDYYPDLAYDVGLRAMRYVTTDPPYHGVYTLYLLRTCRLDIILYTSCVYVFTGATLVVVPKKLEYKIIYFRGIHYVCRFSFLFSFRCCDLILKIETFLVLITYNLSIPKLYIHDKFIACFPL